MRLMGDMHVKTNLLNSINNIWTSEDQVLQSSSKTAKISRVGNRNSTIRRELWICVNWRGTRLAVRHTGTLKNLHHILALGQKKTRTTVLHMYTQKMMKLTEIFHGELPLEG